MNTDYLPLEKRCLSCLSWKVSAIPYFSGAAKVLCILIIEHAWNPV
ncbi:hypothetical protein CGSSp9BS68_04090 [Streptococcus pneumoniae SP9-BS68]|nr:hypothetical protein CGSSp3BS71_09736 [Streptococcus pneumoniae SP3-BS71]EDK79583.1 hypothetical protein CGSSp9BS68_04090 [Streptococcus pneumoniae SP9-BS68]EFL66785.1 hypothetical protein CGSSp14BS292_09942 [Streptococcus pneumoniae SP14-BS292]EFL69144.1 hypothetical protein CGSSpBS293_05117 [Streptococcus pneumoniae SP-BS293]EFL71776.1 hypothetical protein CGSSpBS458_04698 [Streptococcus pneumoniae BS458]EFL74276.1 hypothetical protein CGSSpBS457_07501 [Streptococcus pneumoniae BS457]EFL